MTTCGVAQDLLWRAEGTGGVLGRGLDLHRIGDFNQDGWEDIIETTAAIAPGPIGPHARVSMRVTSGLDGTTLSSGMPVPSYWNIGNMAPLGDMDQDGYPDYGAFVYDALNVAPTQALGVFSGLTHQTIWTAQIPNAFGTGFGQVLCGDLDVNGDGRPDVVTSAYSLSALGTIIVYDNSGTELYRIIDPLPNVHVGLDVASLRGDLDGDGHDDFVSSGPDTTNRGAIVAFSGATGAVLRVSLGDQPGDKLVNAGACGDVDRDGVLDYCGGGSFGASVVTAFSGATGQIIHSWRDTTYCCMGINVNGGYDLDQDGVPDLAAGSLGTAMNVFSGRDGSFLWRFLPTANHNTCPGESLAMLAPPPGEQYPLFAYSERCWASATNTSTSNGMFPGVVHCYRGCPPGVRRYGLPDAAPGQPAAIAGMRNLEVASTPGVRFTMSEAPAGAIAVLMLGTSDAVFQGLALPIGLDPFGLPGITLWQSADASVLMLCGQSGMAQGYAEYQLPLPAGTSFAYAGAPLFAQWIWADPSNLANHGSTAGQRFRLQ